MDPKRETAVNDQRETRDGQPEGVRMNRHDRRAAAKISRQIADVDRQIEKLEAKERNDRNG